MPWLNASRPAPAVFSVVSSWFATGASDKVGRTATGGSGCAEKASRSQAGSGEGFNCGVDGVEESSDRFGFKPSTGASGLSASGLGCSARRGGWTFAESLGRRRSKEIPRYNMTGPAIKVTKYILLAAASKNI